MQNFGARLAAALLLLSVVAATAQEPGGALPAAPPAGQITGRIVGEDGQPLANAFVLARGLRRNFAQTLSDADGKFTLGNLERGPYDVSGSVAGYFDEAYLASERGTRNYYHPGDSLTIRMSRGSVITGRVLDADGKPIIAVRVTAVRLRGVDGRPPTAPFFIGATERTTDDRGVYRIYGLLPGTYIVSAGGRARFGFDPRLTPYDNDAPTFYPSTTRDGATEVVLQAGQEAADIDIRYRGEAGHAISGIVEGAPSVTTPVSVSLLVAAGNYLQDGRYMPGPESSFVFDPLPDGDYDLFATRLDKERAPVAVASVRISVRGADVTGVRLVPTLLASLAGRVLLEAAPADAAWRARCESKLDAVAGDTVIALQHERERRTDRPQIIARRFDIAPDDKGEFLFRALMPGRFQLEVRPPTSDWYVRAATFTPGANTTPTAPGNAARTRPVPAAPAPTRAVAANPLAEGLLLGAGTQASPLTFTLAPGAAALRGRVAAQTEGAPLPELLVYLSPAERERADDALRYSVARVAADGAFAFTHLAPGRYYLLARPTPPRKQAVDDDEALPFPDAPARARLRRDAADADNVELQPCQRRDDYVLRYAPPR